MQWRATLCSLLVLVCAFVRIARGTIMFKTNATAMISLTPNADSSQLACSGEFAAAEFTCAETVSGLCARVAALEAQLQQVQLQQVQLELQLQDIVARVYHLPPAQPPAPSPPFIATGGSVSMLVLGGRTFRRHVFTTSGVFTMPSAATIDVLLVGGGGGCGYSRYHGGGGGAGGLVHATSFEVSAGMYTIVVGGGGSGASSYASAPSNGANTTGFGLVATGGGAGGYYTGCSSNAGDDGGKPGGSGGGGGGSCNGLNANADYFTGGTSTQDTYADRANVQGYGNPGGLGDGPYPHVSAGGGGAGGPGMPGTSTAVGGAGMDFSTIFGNSVGDSGWFAGGGSGGAYETTNSHPPAMGGGGAHSSGSGQPGAANTGGGCGASERGVDEPGKSGGSGVAIVRYQVA